VRKEEAEEEEKGRQEEDLQETAAQMYPEADP